MQSYLGPEGHAEIDQLRQHIDELTQERDMLHLELENNQRKEELADHEIQQNKRGEENEHEDTEEKHEGDEEDEEALSIMKAGVAEIRRLLQSLNESESFNAQLQGSIQQLEKERDYLNQQLSNNSQIKKENMQNIPNDAGNQNGMLENFAESFEGVFQELVKIDFREYLFADEDPSNAQLLESPLELKLVRIKNVVIRFFELRDRFNSLFNEREDLIKRLNAAMTENSNHSASADQNRNQLVYELNELTAVLDQKQEEVKDMSNYIKQLEHERNSLYRRLEEQRAVGKPQSQISQVIELLDGTLQLLFTADETRSMTPDQKITEMQNVVREYQSLREEYRDLVEEKDYLQVTLDSVTNKLKAQQAEIEFLNRQIDIMRNEVAAFIKMDEFKSAERMKSENTKLKQELEALKADKEKLEREYNQDKTSLESLRNENKHLQKTVQELEESQDKYQKEIRALTAQINDKNAEIEILQKQIKELGLQNDEIVHLLESEREQSRHKEHDFMELTHQFNDLNGRFEKVNLLLDHERNESYKKRAQSQRPHTASISVNTKER